jgi:O-methyltransferase involved in polyketide biosynthesis
MARVYDYWLGGKDNFAADREVADQVLALYPPTADIVRENRQFLSRAATWVANKGISQFIDLGAGLPTPPTVHESARAVAAGARVVCVENDVVAVRHLQALAASGNPGVTVVDGDVHETDAILAAVSGSLDLSAPACLVMGALLHSMAAETSRELVRRYTAALAPGSYVILSVIRGDGDVADEGFSAYNNGGPAVGHNHSIAEFTGFFGGAELVPPGVVDAREWHPDETETAELTPRAAQALVGVARV